MARVQWCEFCGRALGIGCNCGVPFKERIKHQQVDRFGLLDMDRKRAEPKNRGLQRKTK